MKKFMNDTTANTTTNTTKMKEIKVMKKFKKLVITGIAAVLVCGSTLSVSAADYRDVFDAQFYAEEYEDLAEAFGNDEEALYQHYITFGINEGRIASENFHVRNYRSMYSDLENAFGDDWAAYVDHYLTYGMAEGRDTGAEFDAVSYANRYEDLYEAFGYDAEALYNHYLTYGMQEGRIALSQQVMEWMAEAEKAAAAKKAAAEEAAAEKSDQEKGDIEETVNTEEVDAEENADVEDIAGGDVAEDTKDSSGGVSQDDSRQEETDQEGTGQSGTEQEDAEQSDAEQEDTEQSDAEQEDAEQSDAEQEDTEQSGNTSQEDPDMTDNQDNVSDGNISAGDTDTYSEELQMALELLADAEEAWKTRDMETYGYLLEKLTLVRVLLWEDAEQEFIEQEIIAARVENGEGFLKSPTISVKPSVEGKGDQGIVDTTGLPEDRAWIDDLYNKLIANDYEGVMAILADDSIAEKAEPYKYVSYVYDAYGYKLVTTDGRVVGLHLPKDLSKRGMRAAFYATNGENNYGFSHTEGDDHEVSMYYDPATGVESYEWLDGNSVITYSDGRTYTIDSGEAYTVWAM